MQGESLAEALCAKGCYKPRGKPWQGRMLASTQCPELGRPGKLLSLVPAHGG